MCSKERRLDRLWSHHPPRPGHHRPVQPEQTIPLQKEGRQAQQSNGTRNPSFYSLPCSTSSRWQHKPLALSTQTSIFNRSMRTLRSPSLMSTGFNPSISFSTPLTTLVSRSTPRLPSFRDWVRVRRAPTREQDVHGSRHSTRRVGYSWLPGPGPATSKGSCKSPKHPTPPTWPVGSH